VTSSVSSKHNVWPADDDDGDGTAFFGSGAGAEGKGQHAGDQREVLNRP
jgi:hypothetical protein